MAVLRGGLTGLGLGLLWGVVARVFMRLLTTDPHFSWSGTLFIVGIGAVAGTCFGVVHAARVSGRRGWWRLAALPALVVFAGPGMLLLPAAVGFAMVLRGGVVLRTAGVLLAAASPVVVVATAETAQVSTMQAAGLALMVLASVPLGLGIADAVGRWRPRGEPVGSAPAQPSGADLQVAHA